MAYNPQSAAIKNLRTKKAGLDTFFEPEEMQAGVEDLNLQNRETDLAPNLKGEQNQLPDMEIGDERDGILPMQKDEEMEYQQMGGDQGDSVLPKGMYEPGDENKKGFMGKAAALMKKKMGI